MEHHQQGTADNLAQGQSGGSSVGAQSRREASRELHSERQFGVTDRDRTFELLSLFEIPIGLAPGDGAAPGEALGGLGQMLVFAQQGTSQVEPLGFLGIAGAGHTHINTPVYVTSQGLYHPLLSSCCFRYGATRSNSKLSFAFRPSSALC
jgi:hypothetical protein